MCVVRGGRVIAREGPGPPGAQRWSHFKMLTALARTSAVVDRAMALCSAISDFAHRDSGMVSVGENAMTLVKLV